ncbi:MAG: hypothetical protein SF123_13915 [Chloroflexota bacterium]|nr:hypothetical protein [Chloroflexota bacterium]
MTIDANDDPANPDCTLTDQTTTGGYTQRGWRYCPTEQSATGNWKFHPGIVEYFDSLPGGNSIGLITLTEIQTVIWTSPTNGFQNAGALKGDPENPNDANIGNFNAMINRFSAGGELGSLSIGDYLYIINHGFIVVGWGPFRGTIEGIAYAQSNTLAPTRSLTNPIPYVADFCFGTDGEGNDGTGWLQDPRPRPFYAAATQVYQENLRSDQTSYLKRRGVDRDLNPSTPPVIEVVYDNFVAEGDVWRFYKIPDSIALTTVPTSRLYFAG